MLQIRKWRWRRAAEIISDDGDVQANFGDFDMTELFRLSAVAALLLSAAPAAAQPTLFSADDWRADLAQLKAAFEETHPNLYVATTPEDFDAKFAALHDDIPDLTDKQIVVRLEALFGAVRDGHTGLAVPFQMSNLVGFPPAPSNSPELLLTNFPIKFAWFSDGVFVTAATENHADLIGLRVESIGGAPIDAVHERLAEITHFDNESSALLITMHYAASPDVLAAVGLIDNADRVDFALTDDAGAARTVTLGPIRDDDGAWTGQDGHAQTGTGSRTRCPDGPPYCVIDMADDGLVYVRIDAVTSDVRRPLAAVMRDAVTLAEERDVKLVVDLRDNPGGSGEFGRAVPLAIAASDELNQYGRTFVLTSRRTFSAAQLMTTELELYTRALFVGEPTGARPTHYGDGTRFQLERSGLMGHVSTAAHLGTSIHDSRTEATPHFDAAFSSADYFGGGDPALAFAAAYDGPTEAVGVVEHVLRADDSMRAYLTLGHEFSAPTSPNHDLVPGIIALSESFRDEGDADRAATALQMAGFVFRGDPRLAAAQAALDVTD